MTCSWCQEPLPDGAHGNSRYHDYCLRAKNSLRCQEYDRTHPARRAYKTAWMRRKRVVA